MIALVLSLMRADGLGGEVVGDRVDVGEHRNGALIKDGRDGPHVGDRGRPG